MERVLGPEISSNLELQVARAAGFLFRDIVLNGLGRSGRVLKEVALEGGLVTCETPRDASILMSLAGVGPNQIRVGIRLRPSRLRFGAAYTDESSKLGLDWQPTNKRGCLSGLLNAIPRSASRRCTVTSAVGGATPRHLMELLASMEQALQVLRSHGLGSNIEVIDLGGGLPAHEPGIWWEAEGALRPILARVSRILPHGRLFLEPGRAVFSSAGFLVTSVVDVRRRGSVVDVVVDGGTNVLLPLQTASYQLLEPIPAGGDVHLIVDGITNPENVIAKVRLQVSPRIGERLLIGQAGAYTQSMSEFWIYQPCQIAWIDDSGRCSLVLTNKAIGRAGGILLGLKVQRTQTA